MNRSIGMVAIFFAKKAGKREGGLRMFWRSQTAPGCAVRELGLTLMATQSGKDVFRTFWVYRREERREKERGEVERRETRPLQYGGLVRRQSVRHGGGVWCELGGGGGGLVVQKIILLDKKII